MIPKLLEIGPDKKRIKIENIVDLIEWVDNSQFIEIVNKYPKEEIDRMRKMCKSALKELYDRRWADIRQRRADDRYAEQNKTGA